MAGPSKAGMTAPMNERPRALNLPAISRMLVFRLEKHSVKRSELCKICAKGVRHPGWCPTRVINRSMTEPGAGRQPDDLPGHQTARFPTSDHSLPRSCNSTRDWDHDD